MSVKDEMRLYYFAFKILLGGTCFVLAVEHLFFYIRFSNILYIWDMLTLFLVSITLSVEGWRHYLKELKKPKVGANL